MGAADSLAIGWRLSSLSGWGVYGTNLALELRGNPDPRVRHADSNTVLRRQVLDLQ